VVEIVDQPARAPVRVRKTLSEPVGPDDRSGFTFSVVRADGGVAGELVTGADGVSGELQLPIGSYRICETATPDWAAGYVDGGCLELTISLDDVTSPATGTATLTFDYLNVVPTTTTSTTTTTTTVTPTSQPPPETTAPEVPTTSTSTTTTPATSTTVVANLPPATPPQPDAPTLPRTGADGVGRLLALADIGFVAGVGLVAAAGLLPRRERGTAGR
jgi:hypothetical protein